MKIDFPIPEQYDQLAQLWQEAFGDSEEFVEGFFCTAHAPSRCRCIVKDGRIVAALYWLDTHYAGQRFAYLYAVAVAKSHRGQGLCRILIEDTHKHLSLRGYDGCLLYPASDSLRDLYRKYGYENCTTVSRFTCEAGQQAAQMQRIDRDAYAIARRTYIPEDAVIQEEENVAYLEMMAFFYRGDDFLLAASTEGSKLYSPEYLGPKEKAPGILAALHCTEGTFQTPGDDIPYAMFLGLHPDAKAPGYFGLSFN
jgi:predicted N-acetyltransferase YhbS